MLAKGQRAQDIKELAVGSKNVSRGGLGAREENAMSFMTPCPSLP